MDKVIALSIFGHGKENHHSMHFSTFMRFFSVGIRAYRSIYRGWTVYVAVDSDSYGAFSGYFDRLAGAGIIHLEVMEPQPLGISALWRLRPVSFANHTVCRDADSLPTWREYCCVRNWVKDGTMGHVMNDHRMHTVPVMGGMCGFRKMELPPVTPDCGIDFNVKGSDQDWLTRFAYPMIENSMTEHRFSGYPVKKHNPFGYNGVDASNPDMLPSGIPADTWDQYVNFIGEACFMLEADTVDGKYRPSAREFWCANCDPELEAVMSDAESLYPDLFYWRK